jgi:hypothetical protein
VELLETRHVLAAFKAMLVKTDRTDARSIAQLMRRGWFRPVHCKSLRAQGRIVDGHTKGQPHNRITAGVVINRRIGALVRASV